MDRFDGADIIAVAQGVVMNARGIGGDDAGLVLLVAADAQGTSLAAVAADVVAGRGGLLYR